MKTLKYFARCCFLGLVLTTCAFGQGTPPITCGGQPTCAEVSSFVAAITDFRTILQNTNNKVVTARISFRNKLNRPLILGYVQGSGIATDDRANRYTVYGAQSVRGISEIVGNSVEAKLVLQPGEASEARFEFVWRSAGTEIFGLTFEMDLTIREINTLPGNQLRLGREHALHFGPGLGGSAAPSTAAAPGSTVPGASVRGAGGAPPPAAAAPPVDACAGKPRCYNAGPFVGEVTTFVPSKSSGYHVLQVGLRFRNLTNQLIILAYKDQSAVITDNLGNRYGWPTAQGIGVTAANTANPQFTLNPGQSSNASFTVKRYIGNTGMGSSYNFDLTIATLEVLPSQQIRTIREYAINFADVSTTTPGSALPSASAPPTGSAPPPVDVTGSAPPAAVAQEVDACAGKPGCYSAGPFVAEVNSFIPSQSRGYHVLQVGVRFRNLTNQRVILAYKDQTAVITDNLGNRYGWPTAQGIGVVAGNSANPQFVLNPGQSSTASFTVKRYIGNSGMGASYNFDLTIATLEVLASQQIQNTREYAMNFVGLGATTGGAITAVEPTVEGVTDAVKKLRGIFKKK